MNNGLLEKIDKTALKIYQWAFVLFTVVIIVGSTVFGLYDDNYHSVLHLMAKDLWKTVLLGVSFVAIVVVMIWMVKKIAAVATDINGNSVIAKIADYLYAKSHRLFIFLFVLWSPVSVAIFPGSSGWDLAMQAQEIIDSKASVIANHLMAPYEVYPIANYLVQQGDGLLTNQHNFFLTLIYGGVLKYSLIWFNSFTPGLALLASVQFVFTIAAFTFTLFVLGKVVKNSWAKVVSLLLVGIIFIIPTAAWSLSKNPLFVAAVVLFIGLMIGALKMVISKGEMIAGFTISNLIILITVKYGWLIIVAEFVFLLFVPSMRKIAVVAFLVPLLVFKISMAVLFATGTVIEDDPIESKGIQIQQVALYIQEYPNDLTKFETKELSRIFNLKRIADKYDPGNTDPIKGSGYYDKDTYRYKTIRHKDWRNFNKVWMQMMIKHPSVFIRAAVLKFYGYFDILSNQLRDITVDYPNFELKKENMDEASERTKKRNELDVVLKKNDGIIGFINSGVVYVVLSLVILAVLNFKFGWSSLLISTPFYVQILAMIVSPLNASLRYSLGFVYGLPLLILLLFVSGSSKSKKSMNNFK